MKASNRGEAAGGRGGGVQHPQPGATVYYLVVPATDDITMEILDENKNVIRKFTSVARRRRQWRWAG